MVVKVSKYFDDKFHRDDSHDRSKENLYELNFRGEAQLWKWFGELDRNSSRILRNTINYASDTYLAIDAEQKIVGGYSFILKSGYEDAMMTQVPELGVSCEKI